MLITIVNAGTGNIFSVAKALKRFQVNIIITDDHNVIKSAEKIILPGVGHFKQAMKNLAEKNLIDILNEKAIIQKVPILGICLGMQLMACKSEEGNVPGLGWINAMVNRFESSNNFKIPHMGWNTLSGEFNKTRLLKGLTPDDEFYFVHSYHWNRDAVDEVAARTEYIYMFPSVIEINNLFGVQFHPEKSFKSGEIILQNFVSL